MAQLLLSLIGSDRAGLVQAVSTLVAEHDGNWLQSQLARLGGTFAGVALVELPDDKVTAFEAAAGLLDVIQVVVSPADPASLVEGRTAVLHLLGNDRPGIVREVTTVLASHGVGIDEMHTSTRPAPMADTTLFEATAQVTIPETADVAHLHTALESIAAELMVDLDLDETLDNIGDEPA